MVMLMLLSHYSSLSSLQPTPTKAMITRHLCTRLRAQPPAGRTLRRTLIAQPPPRVIQPRPLPTAFQPGSDEAKANRAYMDEVKRGMEDLRVQAREGGGAKVLEKWKSKGKGKLGVRERCVVSQRPWRELMSAALTRCWTMGARSWSSHP